MKRTESASSTSNPDTAKLFRRATTTTQDELLYNIAQGLVPILNNPAAPSNTFAWPFGLGQAAAEKPPPLAPGVIPDVRQEHFERYLALNGEAFDRFRRLREIANADAGRRLSLADLAEGKARHAQGEGLVQAMRRVPALFFHEDFSLSRPEVWQEVCANDSEDDRAQSLEQLSQWLDVVETHLLREIGARSDHFFEAAGAVQDLQSVLARTHRDVAELHGQVSGMEREMGGASDTVQALTRRRANLEVMLGKARLMDAVASARLALQLLVPAADYGGALDVLDDMQTTMASEDLASLVAFRHLPAQMADTARAMDDLMASDFLRVTQFPLMDAVVDSVLGAIAEAVPATSTAGESNGAAAEPGRGNGDGAAASALAEGYMGRQLSALSLQPARPSTSGGEAAAVDVRDDLLEQLTPLVVGLRRTGRLSGVLQDVRDAASVAVKQGIRDIVERGMPALHGADWAARSHLSLADKLQSLPAPAFLFLLQGIAALTNACLAHTGRVATALAAVLRQSRTPRGQAAGLVAKAREAGQAVSDAAQGRWAKLLGARTAVHAKGQLADLAEVVRASEAFCGMAEAAGCRPMPVLRTSLHSHCKAWLEGLHHRCLAQLTGLLDQETWTAAGVPPGLQAIADSLQHRAAALMRQAAELEVDESSPQGDEPCRDSEAPAAGPLKDGNALSSGPDGGSSAQPGQVAVRASGGLRDGTGAEAGAASVLVVGDGRYTVVNTLLMLLKLLDQYLEFQDAVPGIGQELVRRAVELVKVFNSRSCQLVLGAGAMQVAGLKSITAKHLAMSCQCLGVLIALHPALAASLTLPVPQPRRGLLLPEFDRVLQDLTIHRGEIHAKLVAIMRERLSANLKQLPAVAERWGAGPGARSPAARAPSSFAATNAKQLRILAQVLSPLMQPGELHAIFGAVASLFSRQIVDAFERLEPKGPGWEAQCRADLGHLLACLSSLPLDPAKAPQQLARLSNALSPAGRFAAMPAAAPPAPGSHAPAPAAAAWPSRAGDAGAAGLDAAPTGGAVDAQPSGTAVEPLGPALREADDAAAGSPGCSDQGALGPRDAQPIGRQQGGVIGGGADPSAGPAALANGLTAPRSAVGGPGGPWPAAAAGPPMAAPVTTHDARAFDPAEEPGGVPPADGEPGGGGAAGLEASAGGSMELDAALGTTPDGDLVALLPKPPAAPGLSAPPAAESDPAGPAPAPAQPHAASAGAARGAAPAAQLDAQAPAARQAAAAPGDVAGSSDVASVAMPLGGAAAVGAEGESDLEEVAGVEPAPAPLLLGRIASAGAGSTEHDPPAADGHAWDNAAADRAPRSTAEQSDAGVSHGPDASGQLQGDDLLNASLSAAVDPGQVHQSLDGLSGGDTGIHPSGPDPAMHHVKSG